jgi:subtilisin family serine protease
MDIDILNLSLGIPVFNAGHNCGGYCSVAREAKNAVENGVTVIAASGNADDSKHRYGVHCPAQVETVISVAGYAPWCSHDLVRSDDSGQWWVELSDGYYGPFCGQEGCCEGEACEQHREETLWEGNVSFHNDIPDISAPVFYVSELDDGITVQPGTSFSAPIVSGLVATIVSDLKTSSGSLDPRSIQDGISRAATSLDDGSLYKYDHKNTIRELASEQRTR